MKKHLLRVAAIMTVIMITFITGCSIEKKDNIAKRTLKKAYTLSESEVDHYLQEHNQIKKECLDGKYGKPAIERNKDIGTITTWSDSTISFTIVERTSKWSEEISRQFEEPGKGEKGQKTTIELNISEEEGICSSCRYTYRVEFNRKYFDITTFFIKTDDKWVFSDSQVVVAGFEKKSMNLSRRYVIN